MKYLTFFLVYIMPTMILLGVIEGGLALYLSGNKLACPMFHKSDSETGYTMLPNIKVSCLQAGRFVSIETGPEGKRITPNSPTTNFSYTIHLVGDSQVLGWGLENNQTLAYWIQKQMGNKYKLINHGVPGYGPHAYVGVLDDIPSGDLVIVTQTEVNDLTDAFYDKPSAKIHCNYLTATALGQNMPCWFLNSKIFQAVSTLHKEYLQRIKPLPIGFNAKAYVAAKTLRNRMDLLYKKHVRTRNKNILFATIPWDGSIDKDKLPHYHPKIREPLNLVSTIDEFKLKDRILALPSPETLFFKTDFHLSSEGAKAVAGIIVNALLTAPKDFSQDD
ncbi:MAG TPA: hypothetical protein QF720_04135 [Nitrospinota bacterium]|nr:hypothetical protein [Nitrospinota bacterium]|tara:strand:- start:21468 stop:22463 length:996 start_codon:yes stop_codon:yes gene_type:complete